MSFWRNNKFISKRSLIPESALGLHLRGPCVGGRRQPAAAGRPASADPSRTRSCPLIGCLWSEAPPTHPPGRHRIGPPGQGRNAVTASATFPPRFGSSKSHSDLEGAVGDNGPVRCSRATERRGGARKAGRQAAGRLGSRAPYQEGPGKGPDDPSGRLPLSRAGAIAARAGDRRRRPGLGSGSARAR